MTLKYRLEGHSAVPESDLLTWACWFETADRSVARTELPNGALVCTDFLGLDYNFCACGGEPLLFETMVFDNAPGENHCEHYTSWTEAEAGHLAIVAQLTPSIEERQQ